MPKRIFFFIFLLFLGLFLANSILAQEKNASLYLSPSSGTFFTGSTFDVSVFINTGENDINAVKVDLKFDPRKLQIVTPTSGKSFIEIWISSPNFSNAEGTVTFQGGVPSPGINTSAGLVSTITFRVVAPGESLISILDSSLVLSNDSKGTNVLTSIGKGIYQTTLPTPEGPKVFSPTHPDQNKWYSNNSPTLVWEKEEGVTDFSFNIDQNPFGAPDNNSEGDKTSVSFSSLEDGVWYFHLKAKRGDVWGGVSHYGLLIDTTPPADFQMTVEPILRKENITSREPIVSFLTTDALSGISYYQLKLLGLEGTGKETGLGFFIEVSSPYKLPLLDHGLYRIVVRAFDLAGNWRETAEEIEVIPTEKLFYVSKKGINISNIFLSWPMVILILILLILLIAFLIFLIRRWRKKKQEERYTTG